MPALLCFYVLNFDVKFNDNTYIKYLMVGQCLVVYMAVPTVAQVVVFPSPDNVRWEPFSLLDHNI